MQITKMSYVKYSSVDDASGALKLFKIVLFSTGETQIVIKSEVSYINVARNWALREAKDMLTEFAKVSRLTGKCVA